ncbi:hypothetical protein SGGMMB4_01819 [Sodalis glossinidius str. 'morsitans']|uniref:Uncharacterized protein n=2 Tax=Sodalis glossinidius TaxID=63612 RepID=A0A193QHG4_SODGM|nr:hypothetical protein SGGMMB4_01819 [Sodalis glossinidius str. 'morsitans']
MPLAQLPRTYCLPARKEERWRNPFFDSSSPQALHPEKKEITRYNYDVDGNLTLCVYPDGGQFTLNYFNAGGNTPECPTDPLGFCRFAAEVSFEIPPCDTPTSQIRRINYNMARSPATAQRCCPMTQWCFAARRPISSSISL